MPGTGIAGYIAGWQPSSVSPQAAGFARAVVIGRRRAGRNGRRTCCGRRAGSQTGPPGWAWTRCRRCCFTRR